jgi:hypothetical protein
VTVTGWRARHEARQTDDRRARWRFDRTIARVRVVDDVVAEYATAYCGRPFRRRDIPPLSSAIELPGATWSIEGDVVVELLYAGAGPSRLVVRDIGLLEPLRRALRSRHVTVEHSLRRF